MHKIIFALSLCAITLYSCNLGLKKGDNDNSDIQVITALPDQPLPSAGEIDYTVEIADSTSSGELSTLENLYDNATGWFTFRGSAHRDAPIAGKVKGTPSKIVCDWTFRTDMKGDWGGGSGWNGQPVYVEWHDTMLTKFRQTSPGLTPQFGKRELIVGSLAGKVYFLNFDNGEASRQPIDVVNPVKGSVSLDPAMNGSLYVGHGFPGPEPFGHLAINLCDHTIAYYFGRDKKAYRGWSTYDSSPVAAGQFLFWPGENGSIYKYTRSGNGQLKMHSILRYRVKDAPNSVLGTENSMCIFRNYGYIGDNNGHIICINLNNMHVIWHYDNHDDTDGSIVCETDDTDHPFIYTANEIDVRGDTGTCHFVKLDALNGQKVWEQKIPCTKRMIGKKHFDGGLYCTPLIGHGNCEGMIFASICQPNDSKNADFIAFSKQTGQIIYRIPMDFFAWSSPVAFYNERQELFIVVGDSSGRLYLINGKSGDVIFKEVLGDNFESSPIVKDNMFAVGSRGNRIMRFHVE